MVDMSFELFFRQSGAGWLALSLIKGQMNGTEKPRKDLKK